MKNFTAVTPIEQKALGITQLQTTITGNEMDWSGVVGDGGDFQRRTLFVDNCQSCKNNSMKNATGYDYGYGSSGGGFTSGLTASGILTQLGGVANSIFQGQAAQSASEIAQANAQAEKERTLAAQAAIDRQKAENAGAALENAGAIAKIKAYIVPISIVGGLAILGIATYFIFKKKKIN